MVFEVLSPSDGYVQWYVATADARFPFLRVFLVRAFKNRFYIERRISFSISTIVFKIPPFQPAVYIVWKAPTSYEEQLTEQTATIFPSCDLAKTRV